MVFTILAVAAEDDFDLVDSRRHPVHALHSLVGHCPGLLRHPLGLPCVKGFCLSWRTSLQAAGHFLQRTSLARWPLRHDCPPVLTCTLAEATCSARWPPCCSALSRFSTTRIDGFFDLGMVALIITFDTGGHVLVGYTSQYL